VTGFTFYQRVFEIFDVSGGLPDFGMSDDSTVNTDDIRTTGNNIVPPSIFPVVFHLGTDGSVVIKTSNTAVNF